MKTKGFIYIILGVAIFLIPIAALAQVPISVSVPGNSNPGSSATAGPGSYIANFYQFALLIGGVLALAVVVYGGILYMTSVGNPSGQSEAKEWLWAALWGILLLAGAYLILEIINPQLLNLNLPTLQNTGQTTSQVTTPAGSSGGGSTGGGTSGRTFNISGGTAITQSIANAAAVASGNPPLSSVNSPTGQRVACAWAVNQVLTSDGLSPIDTNSVQSMENALVAGRGTLVDPSQAVAGDIVIQAQDGHVGICMNNGCTQVISNSSSNGSFTWVSNTSFSPSYSGGPGRIYQVNN
jgi:hypothetical protein